MLKNKYKQIKSYITKHWIWVLPILIGIIFYQNVLTREFYIAPVNVVVESSLSEVSAEQALVKMKEIQDAFVKNDSQYISQLKIDLGLNPQACKINKPTSDICKNCTENLIIDNKIKTQKDSPKIAYESKGFKIDDLIKFAREFVNNPIIELSSTVTAQENTKKYKINVTAKIDSKHPYDAEITTDSADGINKKLGFLFLKFTNPAIYASIYYDDNRDEAEKSINIATENYSDFKDNPSAYTLLGYLSLGKDINEHEPERYERAKQNFEKALQICNCNAAAKLGLAKALTYIIEINELKTGPLISERENLLNSLITDKTYAADAYILKIKYSNYPEAIKIAKAAISQYPKNEDLQLSYFSLLASEGDLIASEQYYDEVAIKYKQEFKSEKYSNYILFMKSIKDLNRYLWDEKASAKEKQNYLEELNKFSHNLNTCELRMWIDYVYVYQKSLNEKSKETLLRILDDRLLFEEASGRYSYHTHNKHAQILEQLGDFDGAIEQAKKSLLYSNVKYQDYNNISNLYYYAADNQNIEIANENFKESENYALKSYSAKQTYRAAGNYLASILSQKDYKRYLLEYKIYGDYIKAKATKEMSRTTLLNHGLANCKVGKKNEARNDLDEALNISKTPENHQTKLLIECLETQ